jgi:hypothetical protein
MENIKRKDQRPILKARTKFQVVSWTT